MPVPALQCPALSAACRVTSSGHELPHEMDSLPGCVGSSIVMMLAVAAAAHPVLPHGHACVCQRCTKFMAVSSQVSAAGCCCSSQHTAGLHKPLG